MFFEWNGMVWKGGIKRWKSKGNLRVFLLLVLGWESKNKKMTTGYIYRRQKPKFLGSKTVLGRFKINGPDGNGWASPQSENKVFIPKWAKDNVYGPADGPDERNGHLSCRPSSGPTTEGPMDGIRLLGRRLIESKDQRPNSSTKRLNIYKRVIAPHYSPPTFVRLSCVTDK